MGADCPSWSLVWLLIILSWIGLPVKGGGTQRMVPTKRDKGIPIPPPREGRDSIMGSSVAAHSSFQSTLPVRGGTAAEDRDAQVYRISIHPPRGGEGRLRSTLKSLSNTFQSALPVWGGTRCGPERQHLPGISIHPPRVGRDLVGIHQGNDGVVSIHPPRKGRDRLSILVGACPIYFNPPSP